MGPVFVCTAVILDLVTVLCCRALTRIFLVNWLLYVAFTVSLSLGLACVLTQIGVFFILEVTVVTHILMLWSECSDRDNFLSLVLSIALTLIFLLSIGLKGEII